MAAITRSGIDAMGRSINPFELLYRVCQPVFNPGFFGFERLAMCRFSTNNNTSQIVTSFKARGFT